MGNQSARIKHTDLPWGDPQLARNKRGDWRGESAASILARFRSRTRY
eukprot:gene26444-biopygen16485